MQVVKILADSQNSALATHVTRKASDDRSLRQSMLKNAPRSVSHMAELRFAIGVKHGKDYRISFQPGSRGNGNWVSLRSSRFGGVLAGKAFHRKERKGCTKDGKKYKSGLQLLLHPCFKRFPQFAQASFEEVIGSVDQDQLLRLGHRSNQRFQLRPWTKLIAGPADEQLRLGAILQEVKRVGARHFTVGNHRTNRRSDADDAANSSVRTGRAQSYGRAERKSSEDQRQVILGVKPVERGADVFDFAIALIVLSLA